MKKSEPKVALEGESSSAEEIQPAAGPDFSSLIVLQIGVTVVAALYFAREVLIPVTISVLLSFVLTPVVHILRRIRVGRVPSILLAVLIALSLLVTIGFVVGTQVGQVATKIPDYAATIENKIATVRAYTVDRALAVIERVGRLAGTAEKDHLASRQSSERASTQGDGDANRNDQSQRKPVPFLETLLPSVLSPIASVVIVLVVTIFVLLQKEDLRDRLIRLFGTRDLHRTTAALDDAARRLSKYFLTQLAINTGFATVVGAGLYLIGVPNPLLWAIFAGIFRFVPYVGAFLSAALPIALAAAVDPGWSMVLWTISLYVVVELVVSQGFEPILYGHSTGLSPFSVIVSAIFWTWIWGPIGLVLSTPLTLCLVVLGRHVERLEFFDVLLGDRPALTPIESFYQRLLAGDVDELQDHSELQLKQRSLSSYYDDVALGGIKLVVRDFERGKLLHRQFHRAKTAIQFLIKELAGFDDEEPAPQTAETGTAGIAKKNVIPRRRPPRKLTEDETVSPRWQTETPVLCLAGNGPFDEAASVMLCQLLEKHGIGARTAPYASREAIAHFETADIAMICVSYLHISGNPPHLRYLIKRLREKFPNAPILVGLWSTDDRPSEQQKAAIGAEFYVSSLREAIERCIKEARKLQA